MNDNTRIAKELLRIARNLVADGTGEDPAAADEEQNDLSVQKVIQQIRQNPKAFADWLKEVKNKPFKQETGMGQSDKVIDVMNEIVREMNNGK